MRERCEGECFKPEPNRPEKTYLYAADPPESPDFPAALIATHNVLHV